MTGLSSPLSTAPTAHQLPSRASGGTTPDSYTHFGFLRFQLDPVDRTMKVDYVNSATAEVLWRSGGGEWE